jgi:glutathione peroxidase-family protein
LARAPLYKLLAGDNSPFRGDIKWRFSKFLIVLDWKILRRPDSKLPPDSPD